MGSRELNDSLVSNDAAIPPAKALGLDIAHRPTPESAVQAARAGASRPREAILNAALVVRGVDQLR
jgi:hypothetical protein